MSAGLNSAVTDNDPSVADDLAVGAVFKTDTVARGAQFERELDDHAWNDGLLELHRPE